MIFSISGRPFPTAPGSYRATSSSDVGWITKQNFMAAILRNAGAEPRLQRKVLHRPGREVATMIESSTELPDLAEIVRIPSPAPRPQSLAHDGESLWLGSWETGHIYGIDPKHGRVFEKAASPGLPVGSTCVGDELRFVISENGDQDNRFIRRFVPGHGFKSRDALGCPDDTGSFVAYDGKRLWLSQRYNKRVHELDAQGRPVRTIEVGEEILGLAWAGERLYVSAWLGRDRNRWHTTVNVYGSAPGRRAIFMGSIPSTAGSSRTPSRPVCRSVPPASATSCVS